MPPPVLPRMRRSTHMFCNLCKQNLQDYGQEYCDRCHANMCINGNTTYDTDVKGKNVILRTLIVFFQGICMCCYTNSAKDELQLNDLDDITEEWYSCDLESHIDF